VTPSGGQTARSSLWGHLGPDQPTDTGSRSTAPSSPSVLHLLGHLRLCEHRVRRAVESRRSTDPDPDNPLRGLYLTDEHVDWALSTRPDDRRLPSDAEDRRILAQVEDEADEVERLGGELRLRMLMRRFELSLLDIELLLVALAPDLDPRFERFYGYLNDDVSRRRATTGLALELCGASALDVVARSRLGEGSPLVRSVLVRLEDHDRPFSARTLVVPDRIAEYLLGGNAPDHALLGRVDEPGEPTGDGSVVARALGLGVPVVYLRDHVGGFAQSTAVAAFADRDLSSLVLDLNRLAACEDRDTLVVLAHREARLRGGGLIAGPVEALARDWPGCLRILAELPGPIVLIGQITWDPGWSRETPLTIRSPVPSQMDRAGVWRKALAGRLETTGMGEDMSQFLLSPEAIRRSVAAATRDAAIDGVPLEAAHILGGARSQNGAGLERLARHIVPVVGWGSLVVGPVVRAQLEGLVGRVRHRTQVLEDWEMRPGGGRGRGITALFAGDPGTGKTMAAEVIAHELGLDLYAVDLSTVVDKYIGETEKNLERIFSEAEGINAVILFDEADALFGKRSEVSDAHDRHANVEVAYLLQRMETFDGLAVLATNLRANLDEAFARRLDAIVDFAVPDADERRVLWDLCLGELAPRGDDLDLDFCADSFDLSGGNIRSIALTAAFLAAESGGPITMAHLMQATHGEYRKLGRLVVGGAFSSGSGAAQP